MDDKRSDWLEVFARVVKTTLQFCRKASFDFDRPDASVWSFDYKIDFRTDLPPKLVPPKMRVLRV